MTHSILAPSAAARRLACPASRALEAQFPGEESPQAREGTAAHWVAEQFIKGTIPPGTELLNTVAPNGEIITQEMIDGAGLFAEDVLSICDTVRPVLEQKINISSIHSDMWGTPDCWAFISNPAGGGHIYVWDYKYGHGPIEVFENWQLLCYVSGILDYLNLRGIYDAATNVTMRIVQPRGYHRDGPIREWTTTAAALRGYFNLLEQSSTESLRDDAQAKPGRECKHCSGRYACPALQNAAFNIIDTTKQNLPQNLPPEILGIVLRDLTQSAELLDALITGLTEQAIALIKSGKRVPGYGIEEGAGRERWAKSIDEVLALGSLMGFNLAKPVEAITPKQAIALGMPEKLIRRCSETPRGAFKLTATDTKKINKLFNEK